MQQMTAASSARYTALVTLGGNDPVRVNLHGNERR